MLAAAAKVFVTHFESESALEWRRIAATHNLLKLFRYRRSQQLTLGAATG